MSLFELFQSFVFFYIFFGRVLLVATISIVCVIGGECLDENLHIDVLILLHSVIDLLLL